MRHWIIGAFAGGLTALLLGLPLSWVGPFVIKQDGLSYSGTVWNGQISGLAGLESLSIQTSPKGLFGKTPIAISGTGNMRVSGRVGPRHAANLSLRVPVKDLPIRDTRLRALGGTIDLSISDARFDLSDGCDTLAGTVRTDVLSVNRTALKWQGPLMSGPLTCEDGNAVADLSGRDDQGQVITAKLTFRPDGRYIADIDVQTAQAEAAAVMPLFGFVPAGRTQYKLSEQGQWR